MAGLCAGYGRDMYEIRQGFVPDMAEICMGYDRELYRIAIHNL
jgi:hypothetical protein